jgi:plasmid maintenance system killer protein
MTSLNNAKVNLIEGSVEWVESMLKFGKQNSYADKYTHDIFLPNAFSSSTLAFSIDKQVNMKLGIKEEFKKEAGMIVGEAVHEYLQGHLSDTYVINKEQRYIIPFEWKSLTAKDIIVISHPDAYSLDDRSLLELKTSMGKDANGRIGEHMKRQACFYWKIIQEKTGIDCDTRIVKIFADELMMKLGIVGWTALPDDKIIYSQDMINRAIETANILDVIYEKKGVPQQSTT